MPMFPARSLWPTRDRTPVMRLGMALMAASGIVASLCSLTAFLIAGMTETTAERVLHVTVQAAAALSALVFLFTLTFGLAAIAVLWRTARRGVMAWALAGAVAGAIAGLLFSASAMSDVRPGLIAAFALAGCAVFVLIRLLAGIGDVPTAT